MDSDVTPSNPDCIAAHCILSSAATDWPTPDGTDAGDVYSVERFLATPIVQHLFSVSLTLV